MCNVSWEGSWKSFGLLWALASTPSAEASFKPVRCLY
jgi:hypothetical protein